MKTLVIGAGGFVGKYLLERLSKTDGELFATKLPSEEISLKNADVTVKNLDITDVEAVFSLFEEIR
ncbi:MAG: NAD-dependent epimerase/dehydratase family protein, partial [Oscillospiraceae bacterium]